MYLIFYRSHARTPDQPLYLVVGPVESVQLVDNGLGAGRFDSPTPIAFNDAKGDGWRLDTDGWPPTLEPYDQTFWHDVFVHPDATRLPSDHPKAVTVDLRGVA